ncbi:MAG: ABC transporter ATP-binding protein [Candidatus Thiodiazotropha endolucinida]|uniref:Hemin import ATP-binding protein HmuV n=1 Tax=Candidatus Thiodiazotropha endolucinida TaxID=1655433 RepID=A0A7Z0VIE8_9GAMM|nr:ABC transporter ATP-binding protein [Candidatus Thiodiazotropha endolucinida]ODJ86145.1 hemin import ATP-binding protein HmuV [Candidatus Thiodiazotropha endolucinida]
MSLLYGESLFVTRNNQPILQDVDIVLERGEMLGLIGPNGAGKSTLLRLLAGVIEADTGSLSLNETPISSVPRSERARRIAYLPQLSEIAWPMSVERIIELGRTPHLEPWQSVGEADREIIERVICHTDLLDFRERSFNTLSGGEQARVLLARAMVTEPDILLADEPVSALDPAHQLDVMNLLRQHCESGHSVIVVLHDLSLAAHYCHRLQLLHHGMTLAEGSAEEVLNEKNLADAYEIELTKANGKALKPTSLPWRRLYRLY